MSIRTVVIGFLALIAGTAAALAANQLIHSWPANKSAAPETANVVVAKNELHRGRTVMEEDLAVKRWPAELVPPGAIDDVSEAAGRVVLTTHFENQPVLEPQLASRDAHSGLATIVPHGMRAFTIHIPTVATGVAGFVLPGNYVDVLLTLNSGVGSKPATVTLLQHIEILAVDQELDVPTDNKMDAKRLQSVTLLVTPEQAAKLSLAESRGTLQLTLRNPDDDTPATVSIISLADLQFLAEEPLQEVSATATPSDTTEREAPKPRSKVLQIRTLRGTQSGVVMVRVPDIAEDNADTDQVVNGGSQTPLH